MDNNKLIKLMYETIFVRDDSNFDKFSGRLDLPKSILDSHRCTSGICKKRNKCLYHKLRNNNNTRTKRCQGYIKFKYKGDTFPELIVFSQEEYMSEILPLILKIYEHEYYR